MQGNELMESQLGKYSVLLEAMSNDLKAIDFNGLKMLLRKKKT
jgi:hypothetical protein